MVTNSQLHHPREVTYKINVTEMKKYLKADQQDTGGTVNDFRAKPEAN